jgi:uncharacterized protein
VTAPRRVPSTSLVAQALTAAVKGGDSEGLAAMLAAAPELAACLVAEPSGEARTPLHLLADAPGGRPRARDTVRVLAGAGADLDAPAVGMWHTETPLHWAASNDDVVLIDALLDAGADIEHPGSSISEGPPIDSALGYGQWNAVRRLRERGAAVSLSHLVALGLVGEVGQALAAARVPQEDLDTCLWNACRRGDVVIARMLTSHGADPGWRAPWSGETPAAIARASGQDHLLPWLSSLPGT